MKRYKRGLFIGKFYPLHKGHVSAINTLASVCEKVYLIFYNSQATEEKIAGKLGYKYDIEQRISDAEDALIDYKNLSVIKLDIPENIVFPDDFKKIQALVEETIGDEADIQIFGAEEKDIYAPFAYANEYILGPIYDVKNKEGKTVPLHATLIRNDYEFYKKHLPPVVRKSLDFISGMNT